MSNSRGDYYIDVDHIEYDSLGEALQYAADNRIIDIVHSNGVSHHAFRTCLTCKEYLR